MESSSPYNVPYSDLPCQFLFSTGIGAGGQEDRNFAEKKCNFFILVIFYSILLLYIFLLNISFLCSGRRFWK